ncbi:MAG: Asp-tRNA(Asn)/Glu-tRNA(Gln) amidotransferase subunit GatB [Candidatus Pacearchaeota archaeon]
MVKPKIGLEIHTYLTTDEKLFCRCKATRERGTVPNTLVCPICTGQPGAKPMRPNLQAVHKAIQIALILGCKVNAHLPWMRKHYNWPDLPKGYQTTMSGFHAIPLGVTGEFEGINISSMHLEEDPASWDPKTGRIDYNRSGLPLVEIVTEPDFVSAQQVYEWVRKLVHALSYLKAVDSNAGIKADVNVSIVEDNGKQKTQRVEVKNVTSIEAMKMAVEFEFTRQSKEGSVRETRRFDEVKGITMRMRGKEEAEDYRFIVDPDLVPVILEKKQIDSIKKTIPELPSVKIEKLIKTHKMSTQDASILSKNIDIALFYEDVAGQVDAKFALPWVTVELMRVLNYNKKRLDEVSINLEHFVTLLKMVKAGKITELQAKQILNQFVPKSFDPSKVEGKISTEKELEPFVKAVIKKETKAVLEYKQGDIKAFNYLLGAVMKATDRRADSLVARKLIEKLLKQ